MLTIFSFSPTLICPSDDEDCDHPTLSFISSSPFKASSPINRNTDIYINRSTGIYDFNQSTIYDVNQSIDINQFEFSLFLPYRKTVQVRG